MPSDEQIVGSPDPKHLYSNQHWGYHNRVHAVYPDTVDALEPRQSPAPLIYETRISAQISNCTAGFDTTKHILPREILAFN
jgi:hypothetical protein